MDSDKVLPIDGRNHQTLHVRAGQNFSRFLQAIAPRLIHRVAAAHLAWCNRRRPPEYCAMSRGIPPKRSWGTNTQEPAFTPTSVFAGCQIKATHASFLPVVIRRPVLSCPCRLFAHSRQIC
jgi:hypothetical protein